MWQSDWFFNTFRFWLVEWSRFGNLVALKSGKERVTFTTSTDECSLPRNNHHISEQALHPFFAWHDRHWQEAALFEQFALIMANPWHYFCQFGHRSLTYFNTVSLSLIHDLYLGQCPFVFPQVIHMDVVGPAGIFGHRSLTYFFTVSVSAWSVTSALARVHLFPPRSYTWMSWNQREVSDIDHWLILSLSISAWSVTPTMARVHLFSPGHTHGGHGTRASFWT